VFIGAEAKKIFDEAQSMLKDIISSGSLEARGVVGFYPAHSVGDDIIIIDPVTFWSKLTGGMPHDQGDQIGRIFNIWLLFTLVFLKFYLNKQFQNTVCCTYFNIQMQFDATIFNFQFKLL
jgi:hypothetical protein